MPPTDGTVPSALAALPTPRNPRYRSLDLWRGVACLLVVAYHAGFYLTENPAAPTDGPSWIAAVLRRLWIGVPMFFVISGYCIAAAADSARRRPFALRSYFWRRVRRIYPPYWAMLAGALVLVGVTEWWLQPGLFADAVHPIARAEWLSLGQWLGNLTLTESWRAHLGGVKQFFVGHAWTLCYEEQFYAVVGVLLLVSRRRFFEGAAVVTLGVAMLVGAARHWHWDLGGFFFDGRWLLFAAGLVVYWVLNYATTRGRHIAQGLLCLAWLATLRHPGAILARENNPFQELFVAFGFALMLTVAHRWDGRLATARILRPLTHCGMLCYSMYLVHWPLVKLLTHAADLHGVRGGWPTLLLLVPATLAVSIGVAEVFHRLVERRFLNAPA